MSLNSYRATAILLISVALTPACKPRAEYVNLARAGSTYAAALDNLLVATGNITIDANSERLLQNDALSNRNLQQYQTISNEDENLLRIISQLRAHVQLLSRYFDLLYKLASSDAPEQAQRAIGDANSGLISNLNRVGNELRGSGLVTGGAAAAAGPIANVVVGGIIRGALKAELTARKGTIQRELILQEELLRALSDRISAELRIAKVAREQRQVITPLISPTPIAKPDEWIANRRSVLTMSLTAEQLRTASEGVKKLREAFQDFVSNKLTLNRVDSLLADFDALLSITEKLKS